MIIDIIQAIILGNNLDDDLWPEIILAKTYIKNISSSKAMNQNNTYLAQNNAHLNIYYL